MFKKMLALSALLLMISSKVVAFDGYVEVTNNTGYDIYYLYVSNEERDDWEEDVLGDDVLMDGDTIRVNLRKQPSPVFDIRAEDEDGDTYTVWGLNVAKRDLVLTLDHLDSANEPSGDFDGYVEVTNNTGYDIYYLYVSNEERDDWGEDVLGDDILTDGETVRVTVRDEASSVFDIRAEDEDGDTYTIWDLDISRRDLELTLDDLD
ncbi:hypothetical protein [Marinobacter mobilis]|uniref:Uncharacterized protein n=1 Tax=Marinobacter mobilis TaxID=488533 RepID=A0A1H2QKC3_9GAMM|nr:hypothetical protein [Marinobacter mobilis]SDW07340.1 hypothetical protein SAMN04487960_101249 [Marinobacter mobilis]